MCKWLSPTGEIIKTRTIREFAERYGMSRDVAAALHCGQRARISGFCSMAPKAKKHRDRFLTKLVNTKTGKETILGASILQFSKQHGLCKNEVWKLVSGRKMIYRHWVLKNTLDLVNPVLAESFSKN